MKKEDPHVTIIDSICGSGKTSYIFDYIKSYTHNPDGSEKKLKNRFFIFVTPFLEEITRLKKNNSTFTEPLSNNTSEESSKTEDLANRLRNGCCNIAMSHSLFLMCIDMIAEHVTKRYLPYELIIDESPDIFYLYDLKKGDIKSLERDIEFTPVTEENDPDGIFKHDLEIEQVAKCSLKNHTREYLKLGHSAEDLFKACEESNVYIIDKHIYISVLPLHKIIAFAEVKFLTYMFEGQFNELYLQAHGFKINYYHVGTYNNGYELISGKKAYSGVHLKDKINVLNPQKTEKSYKFVKPWLHYYDLSSNWHTNNFEGKINETAKKELTDSLKGVYRKFNPIQKNFLWTTYLDRKDIYQSLAFYKEDSCFCSCTARATNRYSNKTNLAYMINLFPNSNINHFTEKLKVDLSFKINIFSLSSLIQWVFRSAIRNNEPINLYIPSRRMRDLFVSWLNGEFEG